MLQVGNDFTAGLSLDTPFLPDGTNADLTKRVPWANEPGCGSCHTGDANDNLADPDDPTVAINAVDSYGNADTIRLIRAFRDAADAETTPSAPDADATPIQPSNTRFAENTVPEFFSQPGDDFANPGAGNPKLYRVSTGHGGVFCEGCHGATHAEWDSDGSPLLNDNVTANQLQGHSGTVTECSTCHGAGWEPDRDDALEGPHGMHVVGDTRFSDGGHEDIAEESAEACFACHGGSSRRDSPGTVLSRAAVARTLSNEGRTVSVAKGEPVGCILCHDGSDD
jgi:hypothetical protein